jgi:hypothetical protein
MGGWAVFSSNVWWATKPDEARAISYKFCDALLIASLECRRLDHGERIRAEFVGDDPKIVRGVHGDGSPPTDCNVDGLPGPSVAGQSQLSRSAGSPTSCATGFALNTEGQRSGFTEGLTERLVKASPPRLVAYVSEVPSLQMRTWRGVTGLPSALPRAAAVVVEDRYSQIFKLSYVRPAVVADGLAELQVRWPGVPIVFCETRQLAEGMDLLLSRRRTLRPSPRAVTETAAADRIGAGIVAVETSTAPSAAEPTSAELRTWARAAGITVPDRGRPRPEVWQAWRDAHAAKRDCP